MSVKFFAKIAALAAVAVTALTACSGLDVVARTAVSTFEVFLAAVPGGASLDAATDRFRVASPGGERFEWSADFSGKGPDFLVAFDASPFIKAGLQADKLPPERYAYDPASGTLSLSFETGTDRFSYSGEPTPMESFKKIVASRRPIVGYHAALDHYGLALGDGNMFEWAKDLAKNDKDMVFVMNPEPFIAAGVDPAKVEGWAFAKVEVKDAAGAKVKVDKFLKPYDLR